MKRKFIYESPYKSRSWAKDRQSTENESEANNELRRKFTSAQGKNEKQKERIKNLENELANAQTWVISEHRQFFIDFLNFENFPHPS